jgi:hypothetical protein
VGVAAAGAGGAVGQYVGNSLQQAGAFQDWSQFGSSLARGTVRGFAAGLTTAALRGGRVSVVQVAADAFGNALGNSIVEDDWGGTARQAVSYTADEQAQDFIRERKRGSWQNDPYPTNEIGRDQVLAAFGNVSGNRYGPGVGTLDGMQFADAGELAMGGRRIMSTDAGGGAYTTPSDLMRFEKASYLPGDFGNPIEPLAGQYDLSNKENFGKYLNALDCPGHQYPLQRRQSRHRTGCPLLVLATGETVRPLTCFLYNVLGRQIGMHDANGNLTR